MKKKVQNTLPAGQKQCKNEELYLKIDKIKLYLRNIIRLGRNRHFVTHYKLKLDKILSGTDIATTF